MFYQLTWDIVTRIWVSSYWSASYDQVSCCNLMVKMRRQSKNWKKSSLSSSNLVQKYTKRFYLQGSIETRCSEETWDRNCDFILVAHAVKLNALTLQALTVSIFRYAVNVRIKPVNLWLWDNLCELKPHATKTICDHQPQVLNVSVEFLIPNVCSKHIPWLQLHGSVHTLPRSACYMQWIYQWSTVLINKKLS